MSIKITSTVRTTPVEELTSVTCDVCQVEFGGNNLNFSYGDRLGYNFANGRFDVNVTKVTIMDGASYPEGGVITALVWDICPECFRRIIVPALEAEKANGPREVEIDL